MESTLGSDPKNKLVVLGYGVKRNHAVLHNLYAATLLSISSTSPIYLEILLAGKLMCDPMGDGGWVVVVGVNDWRSPRFRVPKPGSTASSSLSAPASRMYELFL